MRKLTFYFETGLKLITDQKCLNETAYSFTKRTVRLNNLSNICKTKSGKLISGVCVWGVGEGNPTKNSKTNK